MRRIRRGGPAGIDLLNPVDRTHPLNRGLVSWWLPLPNTFGGGRLWDLMGYRNHGTLTNGPTWTVGPNGFGALSLDGSDDRVANTAFVGGQNIGTGSYTVTVTALWRTVTGTQSAASWSSGGGAPSATAQMGVQGGGSFKVNQNGGGTVVDSGFSPSANTWYRLTFTRDGADSRIYVNGVLRATSGTDPASGSMLYLTAGQYFDDRVFDSMNGLVAEVAYHDRCLSDPEDAAFYDQWRRGHPDLLRRTRGTVYAIDDVGGGGGGNRRRRVILGASR